MEQKGYFEQCEEIIYGLEEKLCKLQLTIEDLNAFAFGERGAGIAIEEGKPATGTPVPSSKLQNRMIDASEHADYVVTELSRFAGFMLGSQDEGQSDDSPRPSGIPGSTFTMADLKMPRMMTEEEAATRRNELREAIRDVITEQISECTTPSFIMVEKP